MSSDGRPSTVLVVEDDPDIRTMVETCLTAMGCETVAAASGNEALRIIESDPTIDLMLTDVMMPGISGITLAKRVMQARPDVRILLISAYMDEDVQPEDLPLLRKPFRYEDLESAVFAARAAGSRRETPIA
jgi:CheY-like chemotaxis protein